MYEAQVHTWPNCREITSNSYRDIVFRFSGHCLLWPWPLTFWHRKLISTSMNPNTSVTKTGWNFLHWFLRQCSQGFRLIACCDPQNLISTSMNPNTSVTKIGWNSLHSFWDKVFKRFSRRTDSPTHSRMDRLQYSMPPAPFFNDAWSITTIAMPTVTHSKHVIKYCSVFAHWEHHYEYLSTAPLVGILRA